MKNNENTKIDRRQLHVLIIEGNSCADDGHVKLGVSSGPPCVFSSQPPVYYHTPLG